MARARYQDTARRSWWARFGLWLAAMAQLVTLTVNAMWLIDGHAGFPDRLGPNVESWLHGGIALSVLFCGVVFLRWFAAAYANARFLGLRGGPAAHWAILGWLIPFFHYVVPLRIAQAMWRQAAPVKIGSIAWVGAWWAVWLGWGFLFNFTTSFGELERNAHLRTDGLLTSMAISACTVIAATLAMRVVRRLQNAQVAMHPLARIDEVFGDGPATGPPRLPAPP